MKRFNDEQVVCPFDDKHKMPKQRLQWHIVKCKAKIERDRQGLPTYHCRHNYHHIYFAKEELEAHEADCDFKPIEQKPKEPEFAAPAPGWGQEFKDF